MKRVERRLVVLCVAAIASWFTLAKAPAAVAAPLTEDDVGKLLQLNLDGKAIVSSIHENGIAFRADSGTLAKFKSAGASREVLDALSKAAHAKPARGGMPWEKTVIVVDCSKRTLEKTTDGVPRIEIVRQVVGNLVQRAAADSQMAVVLFGLGPSPLGRPAEGKQASGAARVLFPLGKMTDAAKTDLILQIAMLGPGGDDAPVATALEMAGKELDKGDGKGAILLITGGGDTSQADPAAVTAVLKKNPKCVGITVFGLHLSPEQQKVMQNVAGTKGDFYNFESLRQLAAMAGPKPATPVVRGQAPETVATGHRGIRIAAPGLQLPKLAKIALVKENDSAPGTDYYKPIVEVSAYGQELRLPSADKYDVYWVPEGGVPVLMIHGFSIAERNVLEFHPEAYLGVLRVSNSGESAPKLLALTKVGEPGPGASYFKPVQTAKGFGQDMVAPAGKYDLWLHPQSGMAQMLEGKLEVKAGQVTVIQ